MVLARVLLMTCVCAALSQTSQALTCHECPWEDYLMSQIGCDTSQTCETDGFCLKATGEGLGQVLTLHSCTPAASTECITTDVGSIKTTTCFCVTHLCNGQSGGGSEDQPGGESGVQSPCRAFSLLLPAVAAILAALMVTSQ